MSKKAALEVTAEVFAWVAMMIIIIVFAIFLAIFSKPAIKEVQAGQLEGIDAKMLNLRFLTAPAKYEGVNVTIAYLLSTIRSDDDADKVMASLQEAMRNIAYMTGTSFLFSVTTNTGYFFYVPWKEKLLTKERFDYTLPTPTAARSSNIVITPIFTKSIKLGAYRNLGAHFSLFQSMAYYKGFIYVSPDGRQWAYVSGYWQEEGWPCKTMREGTKRKCSDGTTSIPNECKISDSNLRRGIETDHAACARSLKRGPDLAILTSRVKWIERAREVCKYSTSEGSIAPWGDSIVYNVKSIYVIEPKDRTAVDEPHWESNSFNKAVITIPMCEGI